MILAFLLRKLLKPVKNFSIGCQGPENKIMSIQVLLGTIFRVTNGWLFVDIFFKYQHEQIQLK